MGVSFAYLSVLEGKGAAVEMKKLKARLDCLPWFWRMHMRYRFFRYRHISESDELGLICGLDLKGRTVLDIGANNGCYSYWMSRSVGPEGRLVAFDAQPELKQHLERVRDDFRLRNMTVVSKGLSDKPGVLTLSRDYVGQGNASFQASGDPCQAAVEVEVVTLDALYSEGLFDDVAFIKCDVEGWELPVFQGGREMLEKDRPTILFECHSERAVEGSLFAFFEELGYDGFFILDGKAHPYKDFAQHLDDKPGSMLENYFFAPRDQVSALMESVGK